MPHKVFEFILIIFNSDPLFKGKNKRDIKHTLSILHFSKSRRLTPESHLKD